MIENFTVKSFFTMQFGGDQLDEAYFNNIDDCKDWAQDELDDLMINNYNSQIFVFEIHHSVGAKTYLTGSPSTITSKVIKWEETAHHEVDLPLLTPWWSINDIPKEIMKGK